jgi:hypothetical protein
MKALIVLFLCPLFCTFASTACKKGGVKPNDSDTSGIVLLRDKSVTEVKSILKGNWKIHYRYGGFIGNQKQVLPNSYLRFLSSDSVYVTLFDQPYAADKAAFTRKKTEFGYTACSMKFSLLNALESEWIIDYEHGDTLVLVDNSVEPFGYHMTEIP